MYYLLGIALLTVALILIVVYCREHHRPYANGYNPTHVTSVNIEWNSTGAMDQLYMAISSYGIPSMLDEYEGGYAIWYKDQLVDTIWETIAVYDVVDGGVSKNIAMTIPIMLESGDQSNVREVSPNLYYNRNDGTLTISTRSLQEGVAALYAALQVVNDKMTIADASRYIAKSTDINGNMSYDTSKVADMLAYMADVL